MKRRQRNSVISSLKWLGVTAEEIAELGVKDAARRAFRKLAKQIHPDKGGDQDLFKRAVQHLENVLNSEVHTLAGQDVLIPIELDEEWLEEFQSGAVELVVTVNRTQYLTDTRPVSIQTQIPFEELDQVVVLEGLGEEGYPDGNLVILFVNLFRTDDGLLAVLRRQGRDGEIRGD